MAPRLIWAVDWPGEALFEAGEDGALLDANSARLAGVGGELEKK